MRSPGRTIFQLPQCLPALRIIIGSVREAVCCQTCLPKLFAAETTTPKRKCNPHQCCASGYITRFFLVKQWNHLSKSQRAHLVGLESGHKGTRQPERNASNHVLTCQANGQIEFVSRRGWASFVAHKPGKAFRHSFKPVLVFLILSVLQTRGSFATIRVCPFFEGTFLLVVLKGKPGEHRKPF